MQQVSNRTKTDIVTHRDIEIDAGLPMWARRSNPVVRRELGAFWKRLLPDMNLVSKIVGFQVLLLLVMPIQFVMTLTLPVAMLAVVLMPVVLFFYARVLLSVVNTAATSITAASNNYTLDLLRVTPIPLPRIILGKIAASVWQSIEDIDLVVLGLAIFSLPFLTIHYLDSGTMQDTMYAMRLVAIAGLITLPIRALIEPFMFSAMAIAMGSALPTRAAAVVSTLGLMVFYYLMLFIPLTAPLGIGLRVFLEIVLPLLLPCLLTFASLMFALWYIERN